MTTKEISYCNVLAFRPLPKAGALLCILPGRSWAADLSWNRFTPKVTCKGIKQPQTLETLRY